MPYNLNLGVPAKPNPTPKEQHWSPLGYTLPYEVHRTPKKI